jgi:hypothetical protein
MELREAGLTEIFERLKLRKTTIGLKKFRWNPTDTISEEDDTPCLLMFEGVDLVIEKASRGTTGYPARRRLEVNLEIVAGKDDNVKQIYSKVREAVFKDRTPEETVTSVVAENTFIAENRTEGPVSYGLPNILGMRLFLDLIYTDKGVQ